MTHYIINKIIVDPEDNENDFKKKLAKVLFKRRINLK